MATSSPNCATERYFLFRRDEAERLALFLKNRQQPTAVGADEWRSLTTARATGISWRICGALVDAFGAGVLETLR